MQGQAGLHWGNAGGIVAVSIPLRKFHVFQEIVSKARKQQLCLETIDVSLLLQEVLNHLSKNNAMKSLLSGVFHPDEASSETGCFLSLPGDCCGRG